MTRKTPERLAAETAGARHYMPSKRCPRGHLAPRFTNGGRCTACAAYNQARRDERLRRATAGPVVWRLGRGWILEGMRHD